MPMEKQTVGIPLLGLNTVADPKSAAAGEFDLVENMFFNRTARGGAELRKRCGGAALSRSMVPFGGAAALTNGNRLATRASERLQIGNSSSVTDPGSLYLFSDQQLLWKQAGRFANLGQGACPPAGFAYEPANNSFLGYRDPDVAASPDGKLLCYVSIQTNSAVTNNAVFTTIDVATGEQLVVASFLGTVALTVGWVRVFALSDRFMIFFSGSVAGRITVCTVLYSSPILSGTQVNVFTDLNASCRAAMVKRASADSVLVAYHSTVPDLRFSEVTQTSPTTFAATGPLVVAEATCQCMGFLNWDQSDGNALLGFVSSTTGAKLFTVTIAGPAPVSTTTVDAAIVAAANVTGYKATLGTRLEVFIEVRAAATFNTFIRRWPGTGTATTVWQRSVGIHSGCFSSTSGGLVRFYLMTTYVSPLQSSYALLDVSSPGANLNFIVIGRLLYGLGAGQSSTAALASVGALSSSSAVVAVLRLVQAPAGTKVLGSGMIKVDLAAKSLSQAKLLADNLHLPGGATRYYDGAMCAELGFHLFPETPTGTPGGGGALTLLGSYQFCSVYSWIDNSGKIHRSAPSAPLTVVLTGASNAVTVVTPNLRLTNKDDVAGNTGDSRIIVENYRTVASGTTFFRESVPSPASSQTADTASYVSIDSDVTISANEILYTNGKVLPHIGPPSARLMESWRNRLFLAGTENPNELWVSNEYSPGLGGVTFSDALVMSIESEGGPITALCEMDDRLLIFKRNAIYVLTGNGPTLTGDNQFQQPQRINFTIGAVEQRGVIKTRDGVMFKSTRGIFLLTHAGQPVYAGAGVDIYNSLTVTGSMLLEDEEQVRFVTAEGRTLVYHYGIPGEDGIGKWTTFTNQAAVDCIVWNGKAVHLRSDGTVVEETIGAYVDPSATSINSKVRLAWLSLTQFFGRFRLYGLSLLGDMMATFTLTHRIAYDYDATVAETETKAVTVATLPPLELSPARRRCTAVQVTLEETSTTQGFTVSSWGLEIGTEPGAIKAGTDKFLT